MPVKNSFTLQIGQIKSDPQQYKVLLIIYSAAVQGKYFLDVWIKIPPVKHLGRRPF